MFAVHNSLKRFREDPAWTHERNASKWLRAEFDERACPFNAAEARNTAVDRFQGTVEGLPAQLFHQHAWYRTPGNKYASEADITFSVAVLTLPRRLPDTSAIDGRLAKRRHVKRGRDGELTRTRPIPPSAGTFFYLPGHEPGAAVECASVDAEFGRLVIIDEVLRLTAEAQMGWRLDAGRMVGWVEGRRTVDEILGTARTLAAVLAAFPAWAWEWSATS